ncbi:MAG: crossover junction endodeoxyribonuclease RuvC [Limnochordaceae bacterium]|nr:crossover junction endodeoxyribonuclease RuvC [Limnochordaceae bacterium]
MSGSPAGPLVVAGIDPGLARTGYGVVAIQGRTGRLLASGTIVTRAHMPAHRRLLELYRQLQDVLAEWRPPLVVVERLFLGRNRTSAMAVGEARGVAMLAAAQAGARIVELTPQQVKLMMTGAGRGEKSQVGYMVRALLHVQAPLGPDEADALAVALCGAWMEAEGTAPGGCSAWPAREEASGGP